MNMITLFKKELRYYLNNPIGYIVLILFATTINFLYMKDVFIIGSVSVQSFFSLIPWIFLVFIPALVMRSLAEEKRLNTIEILFTLPVSKLQIMIAKFLTSFVLVCIGLLLTASVPVTFIFLLHLSVPEILTGYMGCLLVACVFISISLFFSSLTKSQVVSFLFSLVTLFIFLGISSELLSSVLPKVAQDILIYFSPIYHFQNFIKGIIDLRSLYYFISITVLFLFLTLIRLRKRD